MQRFKSSLRRTPAWACRFILENKHGKPSRETGTPSKNFGKWIVIGTFKSSILTSHTAVRPIEGLSAPAMLPTAPLSGPPQKKIDWEGAKSCLAELDREAPELLHQGVIIGGIACWFYRHQLARARDIDFKISELTPAQESLWLSKDIDFTNFFVQDARELLSRHIVTDAQGRLQIKVAGIPIGFAQVGVTFDPESAWLSSWIGTFTRDETIVQCRILDPITLYREKLALSQKRGLESDRLHCDLLSEYLRFEACCQARTLATAKRLEEKAAPLKFLFAVLDRAPEICQDGRLHRRILEQSAWASALSPAEQKLLRKISELGGTPSHDR
jgi:hypothetical protein